MNMSRMDKKQVYRELSEYRRLSGLSTTTVDGMFGLIKGLCMVMDKTPEKLKISVEAHLIDANRRLTYLETGA